MRGKSKKIISVIIIAVICLAMVASCALMISHDEHQTQGVCVVCVFIIRLGRLMNTLPYFGTALIFFAVIHIMRAFYGIANVSKYVFTLVSQAIQMNN